MNEFTKEELIDLIYACNVADSHDMENRYVVINKIQSMIDNYDDSETVIVRGIKRKLREFIKDEKEDKEIK